MPKFFCLAHLLRKLWINGTGVRGDRRLAVENFETALLRANQSVIRLGANLFTTDGRTAEGYLDHIEAGKVWINDPLIDNVASPFGG